MTNTARHWLPVPGLGDWGVDKVDGVSLGPCLMIRPSAGNGFTPVNRFEVEGLCQAHWGSTALADPLVDALDTAANYLRQSDTMAVKLCLRRLNLPSLNGRQLRLLSALGDVIGCGLSGRQFNAFRHLVGRHFHGPHGHIDKVIEHLHERAEPDYTKNCATYVREALEAGGYDMSGHPILAWQYADFLSHHPQFTPLSPDQYNYGIDPDKYGRQIGDVAVFPKTTKHPKGHIEIWDGKNWVSDTVQPSGWPNRNYRTSGAGPNFRIFRPK